MGQKRAAGPVGHSAARYKVQVRAAALDDRFDRPPSVLVVEDDRDLRDLMTVVLENRGFLVEEAMTGPAGLERALALRPDVIVLDVGLPGRDGVAVAEELRRRGLPTAIVLVSAREPRELDLGAVDDFLPKPFAPAELGRRVSDLARRSH
jgi:DNA-binding response OmpR family regulator